MWLLIVIAALWSGALRFSRTPYDRMVLVGGLSVLLGLFICSRAAANMLDLLLFERYAFRQSSWRSDLLWIALNVLVVVAGWITIVEGTTRFIGSRG